MFALQDKNTDRSDFETGGTIRQFVIEAPTLPADAEGQAVKELFESEPEAEGIVVFESSRPVGIIMRTEFYQKMGTLYGHSLYMKRPDQNPDGTGDHVGRRRRQHIEGRHTGHEQGRKQTVRLYCGL